MSADHLAEHIIQVDVFSLFGEQDLVVTGHDPAHTFTFEDPEVLVLALGPVDELDVFEYLGGVFVVIEEVLVDLAPVDQHGGGAVGPAHPTTQQTLCYLHPLLSILSTVVEVNCTGVALRPGVD